MLGLPLSTSLVLSLREIGIGVSHPRDIMDFFSSFITSPPSIFTLYASPVDSHGGYAWVATFYIFGSFSPRDWDWIGVGVASQRDIMDFFSIPS
jgi:hypothetical protein